MTECFNDLSRNADRPAVFALRKRGSETWSYADLDGCVDRLARGLRHAGLARGDRAAIIADNGPEWIAAALAVIRAGGVVVPLDVQLGEKALRYVFGDSTPRFVFTTKNRAERIVACAENARIVLLDATDQDSRSWRRLLLKNAGALPKLGPEDHATLFYTSGTTGPPKGVPLTHSNLRVQIDAALATGLTSEDDHLLLPLPLHHVYPFVIGMLAPLTRGLTMVIPQSLTGPQIIRALQEGEINVVIGVPRLYRALYSGIQARLQSAGPLRGGIARKLLVLSIALRRRFGLRAGKTGEEKGLLGSRYFAEYPTVPASFFGPLLHFIEISARRCDNSLRSFYNSNLLHGSLNSPACSCVSTTLPAAS